jgi:hypothetical protein
VTINLEILAFLRSIVAGAASSDCVVVGLSEDKQDCYEVFTKMVGNVDFPDGLQKLLIAVNE